MNLTSMQWRCRNRIIDLSRPVVMGILNVTPDSFSDGGKYAAVELALEHAARMVAEGATIIDVGGESSRPGSLPIEESLELARVVPVIEGIAAAYSIAISIDTAKPAVMAAAVAAGACIINDSMPCATLGALHGSRDSSRSVPDAHARRAAYDARQSTLQ